MKKRVINTEPEAAKNARKAINRLNKKKTGDPNTPYYLVLGGF